MKTVLVIIQSVMYNRGSEALVRGISSIAKSIGEDVHVILNSSEPNFSSDISLPYVDEYVKKLSFTSKKSIKGVMAAFFGKVLKMKEKEAEIKYKELLNAAKKSDYIVVMAGDNYDVMPGFDFSPYTEFYMRLKKQNNAKILMYDCSMGAENISKSIVEGFNKFDEVTARDSISLKNLEDAGVKNVKYYPDPAFVMPTQKCPLPAGWEQGKMIGLNLSNLILRSKYGGDKETVLKSYYNLIDFIISDTDMKIVLIPHVMNNQDLSVLKIIYEKYKTSNRVILIDNESLRATELKYIISNFEVYIGARTHSTIAAYSTCVPTLVIGYSVKSIGIATDLFGTDKNYVMPIYNIEDEMAVVGGAKWLIEHKEEIRNRLESIMPEYIEKAKGVTELLQ